MAKSEKKVKIKHYFTLDYDDNDVFMKYITDNTIDKQKFLEKILMDFLSKNK